MECEVSQARSEAQSDRLGPLGRVLAVPLIWSVRVYQVTLSPFLGGHCRFEPSCSRYAIDALREHGAWRGGLLLAWRVLRCHPFSRGGYDPVPIRKSRSD